MRRSVWIPLAVVWGMYVVSVVLAWRTASALPAEDDSHLFTAASSGLLLLVLVTSWLHDREADR